MTTAHRDLQIQKILLRALQERNDITNVISNMINLSQKNPYLRYVLEDYNKGMKETIFSLELQKDALTNIYNYLLSQIKDNNIGEDLHIHNEINRISSEIKRLNKDISKIKNSIT